MTNDQEALLNELDACEGEIDDCQYTDEQREQLFKMLRLKPQLVALRWVITSNGRKELMKSNIERGTSNGV